MDTPGTVRDQIRRRGRIAHVLSIAGAVGVGVGAPPKHVYRPWTATESTVHLSLLGVGLLALAVAWFVYRRIKCPWCKKSLSSGYTPKILQLANCPYCGANFDQPMPDAAQGEAENVTTPDKLVWK